MTDPLDVAHEAGQPSRAWIAGTVVVLAVRLVGPLAVGLDDHAGWPLVIRVSEVWVVGGLVVWAMAGMPWRDVLPAMGRFRVTVVTALVAMLFAGQYASFTVDRYPFLGWAMYTSPVDSIEYVELVGIVGGEVAGEMPLVRPLAISEEPRAVLARIGTLAQQAADGDTSAADTVDGTIRVLARRWDPAVDEVSVRLCTVEDPTVDTPSTCQVLRTVPVAGGG